jgi:AraC-like DNA-binding protein
VVPPHRRRLFWREIVADAFPGMTAEAPEDIRADLSRWSLGELGLVRARSSRARVRRVANQDGHNLVLHLLRRGRLTLEHDHNVASAGAGDIIIADDIHPYGIEISDANDCLIFQLPVSRLGDAYGTGNWHGRTLRAGDPNVGFLDHVFRGLWEHREQFGNIDASMGSVLTEAAVITCRSAGSQADKIEGACSPVEFALRHLDNPELGTTAICEASGLSPRAVQKAFLRETGLTPTAFINERRLDRSAELIAAADARTITEIALHVGFNDPAFFSRCFRRRFAMTPREWRARMGNSA